MRERESVAAVEPGEESSDDARARSAALRRMFEDGQCAWPGLALSSVAFATAIARRIAVRGADAGPAELGALHAESLYLACACQLGVEGSIEAFVRSHGDDIDAALRSRRVPADVRDDLRQDILDKLLIGRPDRPAKIGDYAGRGPLGGWVRVAALRAALNWFAQNTPARGPACSDAIAQVAADPASPDPELQYLRERYRDQVRQALQDALTGLPADERNVLRLHFLDGLSVDGIAAVYGVHRATAARWVGRGREALVKRTQALLGRRLDVGRAEVERLVGLVRSVLDLTVSGLFRTAAR